MFITFMLAAAAAKTISAIAIADVLICTGAVLTAAQPVADQIRCKREEGR